MEGWVNRLNAMIVRNFATFPGLAGVGLLVAWWSLVPSDLLGENPDFDYRSEIDLVYVAGDTAFALAGNVLESGSEFIVSPGGATLSLTDLPISEAGSYQIWIRYHCDDATTAGRLELSSAIKEKSLMSTRKSKVKKWVENDKTEPYYFREYWGSYELEGTQALHFTCDTDSVVKIKSVELLMEHRYPEMVEAIIDESLRRYLGNHYEWSGMPTQWNPSIAWMGVGMMAAATKYELSADQSEKKDLSDRVLQVLKSFNNKNTIFRPRRDKATGVIAHFVRGRNGHSTADSYSTIDTTILVLGALYARNIFPDAEIRSEADALWNSIAWDELIRDRDPASYPYLVYDDGSDGYIGKLYTEYVMLVYLMHQYEVQKYGSSDLLADFSEMPMSVFRDSLALAKQTQPSFLVQFPFYFAGFYKDERFFSFAAAQAYNDRYYSTRLHGDRSAWGVSAGRTPTRGYSVNHYSSNPEQVVRPRIISGFMPVFPPAETDYKRLWDLQDYRYNNGLLQSFIPGNPNGDDWVEPTPPGIDYSSHPMGLAFMHPQLGRGFFDRATEFTFEYSGSYIRSRHSYEIPKTDKTFPLELVGQKFSLDDVVYLQSGSQSIPLQVEEVLRGGMLVTLVCPGEDLQFGSSYDLHYTFTQENRAELVEDFITVSSAGYSGMHKRFPRKENLVGFWNFDVLQEDDRALNLVNPGYKDLRTKSISSFGRVPGVSGSAAYVDNPPRDNFGLVIPEGFDTTSYTLGVWVKLGPYEGIMEGLTLSSDMRFMGFVDVDTEDAFLSPLSFAYNFEQGRLDYFWDVNDKSSLIDYERIKEDFVHICVSYDSDTKHYKVYLNGGLQSEGDVHLENTAYESAIAESDYMLGRLNQNGAYLFDEIVLYNEVLTGSEINQLFEIQGNTSAALTYSTWAAGIDWQGERSAPDEDADGDAFSNLEEYFFKTDPLVIDSFQPPAVLLSGEDIVFEVPPIQDANDVEYCIETSRDMSSGSWSLYTILGGEAGDLRRINIPILEDHLFLRLRVDLVSW
jgi:hypothetical protein